MDTLRLSDVPKTVGDYIDVRLDLEISDRAKVFLTMLYPMLVMI